MSEIRCLFEDKHLYVVHKPPHIPFHSLDESNPKTTELTHVEGFVSLVKKFFNDEDLYPVHRLDRMTSGLMIFARSREVNRELSQQFSAKTIEKYYLALSQLKPKKKQGAIVGDMVKGRSGSYLLKRSNENPAITRFFTKKIILKKGEAWFYILKPETGKTHQLRVSLKSLGSPILGDTRYSGHKASRGYLHAYKVRFELFGQRYDITDPYFEGQEFSLDELNMKLAADMPPSNSDATPFLYPENLHWPTSSFLLSKLGQPR